MGIQLTHTNRVTGQELAYGATGTYNNNLYFATVLLAASSVSAVELSEMSLGSLDLIPSVTFTLSGLTLPVTLPVTDGRTADVNYTITVDNDYLHASTETVTITSIFTATAKLSAGTEMDTPSSLNQAFAEGDILALGDAGAPSPVSSFNAVGGDQTVTLTWNNPTDVDWSSTSIRQSTVASISSVSFGTLVYTATTVNMSSCNLTVPVNGTEVYYYGAYATDNVGKNSSIVTTTPPTSSLPVWKKWSSKAEHSRLYIQDEL
jgi:hypothetical protein